MTTATTPLRFTPAGALAGARLTLPLLPGVVVFASAFGTAATQKGLSLWETMALSGFVFAGASQMVAIEIWRDTWSLTALIGLMTITATINARMILMGAAIQPFLSDMPRGWGALTLFLLADANWLIGMRNHAEGGRDAAVVLGAGVTLWVFWTLFTLPGYLAGGFVEDPEAWGLDLVMPIFFAAMLAPMWKGLRPAVPWAIAGAVALAVQYAIDGYVFIVAGALAGAAAGALMHER